MSTFGSDNIADFAVPSDVLGHTYVFKCTSKAWCHNTAAGGTNDTYNISSFDDDGTGDRGINLSASMVGTDLYAVGFGTNDVGASTSCLFCDLTAGTKGVNGFDFDSFRGSSTINRTNIDTDNYLKIAGDLA